MSVFPGHLDGFALTDEAILHQAGFDSDTIRVDGLDTYGNDPDYMRPHRAAAERREDLPQFGPAFVPYIDDRVSALEKKIDKLLSVWMYEPTTVVFVASLQTSAAGGVDRNTSNNAILYEPMPGWTLALHRLTINAAGFTFGAPFTGAGAYYELRADNDVIDGGSMVAGSGSLPVARTWGTRDAPHIRDGEALSLFMSAGPTNATLYVRGQGTLERDPDA